MSSKIQNNYDIKKVFKDNISSKYIQDSVFDNFDISDLLKKDLYIPKTDLSHFLYKKYLNNSNLASTSTDDNSQPEKIQDEIVAEINNSNHFNIELEKLVLTFKNGYEVPFIDLYKPIKLIGQGHFGLVLSVIHIETNKKMAVKIIKKKKYSDDYYLLETKFLQKLNHERIIKLYDVVNTTKFLFIFTELCEGGSLKDFIISRYNNPNNNYFMKDSECATIIKNIIQGVEYLSNNGIIHRDLKPENIMFRKENDINSLVLCDFGLAGEIIGNNLIESKCGTLIFMAPEIIMNRKYDSLVDIWAIGIIMFILESGGSHPVYVNSMNSKNFIEFIKNKNKINFPDFFPSVARNFFLKLCKYDPFFRYNVNKALNHPWIIRVNHKIPLTVIEDIEKQDKIKNFKNMLITFIFLKQFKKSFKKHKNHEKIPSIKSSKTINKKRYILNNDYNSNNINNINIHNNNKLNTPLLKLDKYNYNYYLNNIKEEANAIPNNNLPILQNPLPREIMHKMYTSKSTKSISCFRQKIKPNDLFGVGEKKNKLQKIKCNRRYLKDIERNKSQKDIFIQRNRKSSNEILKEYNSLIKIHPAFEKRNNLLKFEKCGKKLRLLSSKNLKDEIGILKKIDFISPKLGCHIVPNDKILKPFIPNLRESIK